jgi:hypothetical protein
VRDAEDGRPDDEQHAGREHRQRERARDARHGLHAEPRVAPRDERAHARHAHEPEQERASKPIERRDSALDRRRERQ